MDLQQNLNLITGILKKNVGLQHICREDFILYIKGEQWTHFSDFWRYDNIALNKRFVSVNIVKILLAFM